jgi:hypothetical protein
MISAKCPTQKFFKVNNFQNIILGHDPFRLRLNKGSGSMTLNTNFCEFHKKRLMLNFVPIPF